MSQEPPVVVIGSLNMDLVVRVVTPPRPGETVLARDLAAIHGGKGANQAVGVSRLGAGCTLVGRVGDDLFGEQLLTGLTGAHVDTQHVVVTEGVATGVALITVDEHGENAICVAGGANQRLTPADVDAAADTISASRVCLLQLEIPLETVLHALRLCKRAGVETILDCAPAPAKTPPELFDVDILTPNLVEAEALASGHGGMPQSPKALAAALASRGARSVVIKMGERGALACDGAHCEHVPGIRITPVDTTAAGDAFAAALGVARARGEPLHDAVRFANAAGAAACLKFGAQPSLPTTADVSRLLHQAESQNL